ncbi:hypothetical protein [Salibacterium halotolerans]|uniref:Uncharacterized protein n=1 Tax=Salibacterium halotolerans TaxID=1884432 RepID=A0A1I5TRY5_9BACI|nr:hypothetical protein [Salibacterium halotolerans]SFP85367.1 hypothetical protein SAMN05518683_11153 [Salibacterium halotolerans]
MYIKQNHIQPQTLADIVNQGVGLVLSLFSNMFFIPLVTAVPYFIIVAYLRFIFHEEQPWLSSIISSAGSAAFIWLMGSFTFIILFSEPEATWSGNQKNALRKWTKMLPVLILGFTLFSILSVAGGALFLLPGLLVFLLSMLFPFVTIFEKKPVWQAFKRSAFLMRGALFRGGCLAVLMFWIQIILHTSILTLIPSDEFLMLGISAAVTHAVIVPFQAVVMAVFYFSVRAEKEAFDYKVFQFYASRYDVAQ